MFKKARIKLTAWYLLIVMSISISFSAFIYGNVNREFQIRFSNIQRRLEMQELGIRIPPGQAPLFAEDLKEIRNNVLLILLYTNGIILVFSSLGGYFLAGRTLAPIEKTLEEQKRFIADASHELKTPLTALQTMTEVSLRDKNLTLKDAKEVIKSNLEETVRLSKLANDLLSLTRYESGNGNFKFKKVNLKKLVNGVSNKLEPISGKKKIHIKLSLKNISVNGNEESLEQLITVLLDNAIKYSKSKGRVFVFLEEKNNNAILSFKDNGFGISKEDLPHVFDRFFRADQSRSKENVDGFGLGLSMAKRIVELHKGSINVESTSGKGSIFKVVLPINL
jgi:signal transduction histidine kinase